MKFAIVPTCLESARRMARGLPVLLLLVGCAQGENLPVADGQRAGPYRLGVDDRIRVITYGDSQLSSEFRVADGGDIVVPLVGNVHAQGLTADQLGHSIAGKLKDMSIMRQPSVSVEIVSYRPIFVLGEVLKPGEYPYQPGMTMLQAVSVAGGFTYRAVERYASVVRQGEPQAHEARLLPGSFVQPGDVVKVYERVF